MPKPRRTASNSTIRELQIVRVNSKTTPYQHQELRHILSYFCLQKCRVFAICNICTLTYYPHMNTQTLKDKVNMKIDRSIRQVFLRSDFVKLGGYDQIGRALRDLAAEGKLIKIGYGLYAKARPNRLTGKTMLAAEGGFVAVAKEALKRLGVKWTDTNFDAYQKGATQIPANAEVIVFGRFNRKIGTDKFKLQISQTS